MATFPDLTTFDHFADEAAPAGAGTLTLPIRGREYTWHAGRLSVWAMLMLQRLDQQIADATRKAAAGEPVDMDAVALSTADEQRLDRELIGDDNLARMAADGVMWPEALHVASTLTAWYLNGQGAALKVWERNGEGEKADPPARAASTRTAGSSTRKKTAQARSGGARSSRTGTSSRPRSKRRTAST